MKPKRRIAFCSLAVMLFPLAVSAFNLRFMSDDPLKEFTEEDWQIANGAFDAAIDHNADAEAETWENPKTGSSGSVTPLKTFKDPDGGTCRLMQIINQAKRQQSQYSMSFCRGDDNMWHHSGAKPD